MHALAAAPNIPPERILPHMAMSLTLARSVNYRGWCSTWPACAPSATHALKDAPSPLPRGQKLQHVSA